MRTGRVQVLRKMLRGNAFWLSAAPPSVGPKPLHCKKPSSPSLWVGGAESGAAETRRAWVRSDGEGVIGWSNNECTDSRNTHSRWNIPSDGILPEDCRPTQARLNLDIRHEPSPTDEERWIAGWIESEGVEHAEKVTELHRFFPRPAGGAIVAHGRSRTTASTSTALVGQVAASETRPPVRRLVYRGSASAARRPDRSTCTWALVRSTSRKCT